MRWPVLLDNLHRVPTGKLPLLHSRQEKKMTDIQLRGVVLGKLYEQRSDHNYKPEPGDFIPTLMQTELIRICEQLHQHGLVDAEIIPMLSGEKIMPLCRISARGVDVVETGASPDLRIDFMPSQTIHITGSNNIVGNHNQQTVQNSVQELAKVIDSSSATPEEKAEAKGLLKKFLEHPLLSAVAGGAMGLL